METINTSVKLLITGATGNYGASTIKYLLGKGFPAENINALVRTEDKAAELKAQHINVIIGDYDNLQALDEATRNVDKVLLISGTDGENRSGQHQNVIDASKNNGVKQIIYTSYERKDETPGSPLALVGTSHLATEKAMIESGIPYVFLRNNLYADILPMLLGPAVLETGIFFPAGEGKTAFTLRSEMAEATAEILVTNDHDNRSYYFSAEENVSFGQIAGLLTELTGKNIVYHNPAPEQFIAKMTDSGVPEQQARMLASFGQGIAQGEQEADRSDLEKFLGRRPTSAKVILASIYVK